MWREKRKRKISWRFFRWIFTRLLLSLQSWSMVTFLMFSGIHFYSCVCVSSCLREKWWSWSLSIPIWGYCGSRLLLWMMMEEMVAGDDFRWSKKWLAVKWHTCTHSLFLELYVYRLASDSKILGREKKSSIFNSSVYSHPLTDIKHWMSDQPRFKMSRHSFLSHLSVKNVTLLSIRDSLSVCAPQDL